MIFLRLHWKWKAYHSTPHLSELFCLGCSGLKESWQNSGKTVWVLFFVQKTFLNDAKALDMLILPLLCLPWALTLLFDMEEQSLLAENGGAWTVLSLLGRGCPMEISVCCLCCLEEGL